MNKVSKVFGGVFTLFFVYATAVQLNDIDAWIWVLLYALAAVVSMMFATGRLKKTWCLALFVIYLGLALYHWPASFEGVALQDGMKTTNIELGRESLGMGISALIMLVYFFILKRGSKS